MSRTREGLAPPEAGELHVSASQLSSFQQCPLAYRLERVDRVPVPPREDSVRGTLIHLVLERLFDLPAWSRTPEAAGVLLSESWQEMRETDPDVIALLNEHDPDELTERTIALCSDLLATYFDMEDPSRYEPNGREVPVVHELPERVVLRGYVDRVDVAPDGRVRVRDYKTGKPPSRRYQDKVVTQLRLYALAWWRIHGVVPALLEGFFLGTDPRTGFRGGVVRDVPTPERLEKAERAVLTVSAEIRAAFASGRFLAKPSRLCDWCPFHELCPAQGGVTPPFPLAVEGTS